MLPSSGSWKHYKFFIRIETKKDKALTLIVATIYDLE